MRSSLKMSDYNDEMDRIANEEKIAVFSKEFFDLAGTLNIDHLVNPDLEEITNRLDQLEENLIELSSAFVKLYHELKKLGVDLS